MQTHTDRTKEKIKGIADSLGYVRRKFKHSELEDVVLGNIVRVVLELLAMNTKSTSNISETDITRNGEQSVLNRLFRCETKVYTDEAIAHRLDSLETLVRVILDRLSEVDGKRIKEENTPFGCDIILVKKEH